MPNVARFNPFVASHDPQRYLPRQATERALCRLEHRVAVDASPATLLTGPPGIGKSLLLRVLARRLRPRFRAVSLTAADVDAPALCTLVVDALRGEPGDDPEWALALLCADRVAHGSALLLALDDAHRLPLATAGRLGAIALAAEGGLRIAAAAPSPATELAAALTSGDATVALTDPMSPGESHDFVHAALASAWAPPPVRDLFDRRTIACLHEASGGVPGELSARAGAVVAQAERDGLVAPPWRALYRHAWRAHTAPGTTLVER